jgi:hypothetical protein
VSELLKKAVVLLGSALACGAIGFAVPLIFDRDVGGALAAELLGIAGLIVGSIVGAIIIRRRFD